MSVMPPRVAAEFYEPYASPRVRRLRRDDLQAARQLAERAGYQGNESDTVRFCVAVVAELARVGSTDDLDGAFERVVRQSRSVTGRKRRFDFT